MERQRPITSEESQSAEANNSPITVSNKAQTMEFSSQSTLRTGLDFNTASSIVKSTKESELRNELIALQAEYRSFVNSSTSEINALILDILELQPVLKELQDYQVHKQPVQMTRRKIIRFKG